MSLVSSPLTGVQGRSLGLCQHVQLGEALVGKAQMTSFTAQGQHQLFLGSRESFPMTQRNAEDKESCEKKHGLCDTHPLLGVKNDHKLNISCWEPYSTSQGGSCQLGLTKQLPNEMPGSVVQLTLYVTAKPPVEPPAVRAGPTATPRSMTSA